MALREVQKEIKEINDEVNTLKKSYKEKEAFMGEIKVTHDDLNGLVKYLQDLIDIDRELEILFKTVSTSLYRVMSEALERRQAIGFQGRMTEALKQIEAIDNRLKDLGEREKDLPTKMRALEDKLIKELRFLRGLTKDFRKYAKDTNRRCNKISNVAVDIYETVIRHKGGAFASEKLDERKTFKNRMFAASLPINPK